MSTMSPYGSPDVADDTADEAGVRSRLAKEVAAWSAERSGRGHSDAADLVTVEVKQIEGKQAGKPPRQASKRAAKPAQLKPAAAPGKPFSMSYDGVSSREYMDQVIARGTR